ncbi:glutathione S-transferase [Xylogone sp. PMI_703]|nr:glutathione S-transferase [Xylogone sp. PMI_703]
MALEGVPALKLWYSPEACSMAPHVILLEAGLDFELVLAKVGKFTDEFMAFNPKGRVPVLAMGNEIITEMPAILTAISSFVPDLKLMGKTTQETVRVYEWLNYLSGVLHGQGYGALWRPERFAEDPKLHPALKVKAAGNIKQCYAFIESSFVAAGTTYAVGNSFTAVDPFLLVLYRWSSAPALNLDMADYPHLAQWAGRLSKRESVIGALKVHRSVWQGR